VLLNLKSEMRYESRASTNMISSLQFRHWSLRGYGFTASIIQRNDCVLYWPVEECVLKLAVLL
ncbi:27110_t:CDS:2, partial [Dentiscutata erythropus]